jgi:hypothetical protein
MDMKTWTHETWTWRHRIKIMGNYEVLRKNKREKKNQSPGVFFLNDITNCSRANGSLPFVCLLTKKQTEVISLQED